MQGLGWAAWLAGLRLAGLDWAVQGWAAQAGWLWTGLHRLEWGRTAGAGLAAQCRGRAAWSGAGAAGGGAAWLLDRLGCVVAVCTTHGTGLHRAVLGCTVQGQGLLVVAVEAWAAGGGC
ncbi:hypothetical protein Acr_02g0001450 [Actinidia rufa]|uniref:Uncharacterized protein n=1 Tax=Actinidia rufa TaxID=165716 RepID=A0A7J0E6C8_9ERIC|nr:hypothetical protein Acr_02g0001450 [Actinidia rufa]